MPSRWAFEAIGVPWTIDTPAPLSIPERDAVTALVDRFDRDWSRFRDDSLVARMAREPGSWRLPPEADELLALFGSLHDATDGRMSPLVGDALADLGYDGAYGLAPRTPRAVPAWDEALAWDGSTLTMTRPATLDVGAAGKGLLVDLVGDELLRLGRPDSVVDASGDLRVRGTGAGRTERIALEHPGDPDLAIGVVDLPAGALCGSATNRRAWAGVHHVLDAVTGRPAASVRATWAIADRAMVADGVATALFFAPGRRVVAALGDARVSWVRMLADGRLEASDDFPGELFT